METLRGEGFTLINKSQFITYLLPNGTSAIDLVLSKGNGIKAQHQNGLWASGVALIIKHIPTNTTLEINCQKMGGRNKENEISPGN